MKQTLFMMIQSHSSLVSGYWIGGIIAFLLLAYLLYSLVKPEKF